MGRNKNNERDHSISRLIEPIKTNVRQNARDEHRRAPIIKKCNDAVAEYVVNNYIVGSDWDCSDYYADETSKAGLPFNCSSDKRKAFLINQTIAALQHNNSDMGGVSITSNKQQDLIINNQKYTKGGKPINNPQYSEDCWVELDQHNQQKNTVPNLYEDYGIVAKYFKEKNIILPTPEDLDGGGEVLTKKVVDIWASELDKTSRATKILLLLGMESARTKVEAKNLDTARPTKVLVQPTGTHQAKANTDKGAKTEPEKSPPALDRTLAAVQQDMLLFIKIYAALSMPVFLTYGFAITVAHQIAFFLVILPALTSWIGGLIGWQTPELFPQKNPQ